MGKTYRDVSAGSHSKNYDQNKCRGFQKKKMRSIQHSIRNENRNSDECTFIKTKKKTNNHWSSGYIGIAPNINGYNNCNSIEQKVYEIDRIEENNLFYSGLNSWSGSSLINDLQKIINKLSLESKSERGNHNEFNYLKATLKQLNRRGNAVIFKGHNKDKIY